MNYNKMIIVALALCLCIVVPAMAESMWDNGNWVPNSTYDGYTVYHDAKTGVDSKYNPNVGSKYDISQDPNTYSGRIEVIIKVHMATMNPWLYIANNVTPNITKKIKVNANGLNTIDDLVPGDYVLTLDNFDLPDETQIVTVGAGLQEPSRAVFNGQGVSTLQELYRMRITTDIGCENVKLNGLKLVKDELVTVPESTKQVCSRVKVIDREAWDEVVTDSQAWDETVVDTPAWEEFVPAVTHIVHHPEVTRVVHHPAVTHTVHHDAVYQPTNDQNHVHAKKVYGNSQHDFVYNGDKYQITGSHNDPKFKKVSDAWDETVVDTPAWDETVLEHAAWDETVIDVPAHVVVHPAVTHVVHHPASTHIVHHAAISHYEVQCHSVVIPSYSYWTYKLEGRLSVKSIGTEITNPNNIPLSGTATVVVGYTVDHNFGHLLNTNQDLENVRKTFTGRFVNVQPGTNDYGDVPIAFSERINDAIIVDDYFPSVIESSITTDVPPGYHLN